jgi:hypothetical protein
MGLSVDRGGIGVGARRTNVRLEGSVLVRVCAAYEVATLCRAALWSILALSDRPASRYRGRLQGNNGHRDGAVKTTKLTHFIISRAAIAVLHRQARDMLRSIPLGDAVLA